MFPDSQIARDVKLPQEKEKEEVGEEKRENGKKKLRNLGRSKKRLERETLTRN